MSMTRESSNGTNSKRFTGSAGRPSLARSSSHSEAEIITAARAVYGSLTMGLADFDHATTTLQHKCREIAIAVLDANARFENH